MARIPPPARPRRRLRERDIVDADDGGEGAITTRRR
jgi:hypothetical protein